MKNIDDGTLRVFPSLPGSLTFDEANSLLQTEGITYSHEVIVALMKASTKWYDAAVSERSRRAKFGQALKDIVDPVEAEKRHLKDGEEINWTMLMHMLDGAQYYQSLAKQTLQEDLELAMKQVKK